MLRILVLYEACNVSEAGLLEYHIPVRKECVSSPTSEPGHKTQYNTVLFSNYIPNFRLGFLTSYFKSYVLTFCH